MRSVRGVTIGRFALSIALPAFTAPSWNPSIPRIPSVVFASLTVTTPSFPTLTPVPTASPEPLSGGVPISANVERNIDVLVDSAKSGATHFGKAVAIQAIPGRSAISVGRQATKDARQWAVDTDSDIAAVIRGAVPERGYFWFQEDPVVLAAPAGPFAAALAENPEELGRVIGGAINVAPFAAPLATSGGIAVVGAGASLASAGARAAPAIVAPGGNQGATPVVSNGTGVAEPKPFSGYGGSSTPRTTICEAVWDYINSGQLTVEVAKQEYPECFDGV